VNLAGGGAMAVLGLSAMSAHMLLRHPQNEEDTAQKQLVSAKLSDLWDVWSMPVLFSHVGASIRLSQVFNSEFLPDALLCIFCGTVARAVAAFGIFLFQALWYKLLFY
jgi:Kef-type K+ transport system membrane component KefB